MNDIQKQVQEAIKSRTLEGLLEWNNSTLIRGNEFAEEITELKRRPGKDTGVAGSPTLVESLLQDDLLDELTLMVHPVVAGRGKRLFKDGAPRRGRSSWIRRRPKRASSTLPTGRQEGWRRGRFAAPPPASLRQLETRKMPEG